MSPCTRPDFPYTGVVPPFIGQDYFCETVSRQGFSFNILLRWSTLGRSGMRGYQYLLWVQQQTVVLQATPSTNYRWYRVEALWWWGYYQWRHTHWDFWNIYIRWTRFCYYVRIYSILDPIWVYLAGYYELYNSTGTIDCSGLQTTLYCHTAKLIH